MINHIKNILEYFCGLILISIILLIIVIGLYCIFKFIANLFSSSIIIPIILVLSGILILSIILYIVDYRNIHF